MYHIWATKKNSFKIFKKNLKNAYYFERYFLYLIQFAEGKSCSRIFYILFELLILFRTKNFFNLKIVFKKKIILVKLNSIPLQIEDF